MKITDFVSKNNYAYFECFKDGVFYYNIPHVDTYDRYRFQIPIEDVGYATFSATEKSVTLMRWIRKSIENKTFIKL